MALAKTQIFATIVKGAGACLVLGMVGCSSPAEMPSAGDVATEAAPAPRLVHGRPQPKSALAKTTSAARAWDLAPAPSERHRAVDSLPRKTQHRLGESTLLYVPGKGVEVDDPAPGLSASLRITHVSIPSDAVASTEGGMISYTSPSTGVVTYFVSPSSDETLEDLTYFPTAPAKESLEIDLAMPAGAGLRLVGGELAVVDEAGTPRARAAPPSISTKDGQTDEAHFHVLDCAFDASPLPPWNRTVVAPGKASCRVAIEWSGAALGYPLMVDPSWSYATSMATARWSHTASLLANGRLLVAGGQGASSVVASAEIYDPTSATWAATGSLVTARASHMATMLSTNTEVLVTGGDDGTQALANAERYSQSSGTWTAVASMSARRDYHQAFALDSTHVLVAGGVSFTSPTSSPTTLASAEIFDRTAGTWTATTSMGTARAYAMGTFSGPALFATMAGGDDGTFALNSMEQYAPVTKLWLPTVSVLGVRENGVAFAFGASNAIFLGGGTTFLGLPTAANAEYNFSIISWSNGPSFTTPRALAAIAQSGGKWFIIGGGSTSNTSLASTEVFDPTTNTLTAGASLKAARWGHTATTLASGTILVAGGLDAASGTALSSAELYP